MKANLKPLSLLDGKDVWEMLQEIPKEEKGFGNSGNGISFNDFPNYLLTNVKCANSIDLKKDYVPQIVYWLYVDGKAVGFSKLRTKLSNHLLQHGGNIGYGIRPSERGKGYGNLLLKLTLEKAKSKGIDTVLITCDDDNFGSKKVAENNGGLLHKTENNSCYYWIYL